MFDPVSNRAPTLDRAMRNGLADSLDYIVSVMRQRLDLPGCEARAAIDAVRTHRVAPGVFGRYYKLVWAVQAGSLDLARTLFLELIATSGRCANHSVKLYSEPSLGADLKLYRDLLDPDTGLPPWICTPAAGAEFEPRVNGALAMIATADPALADEIRGLAVQIVGAAPFCGPGARPFGSVSSFMLWGLLVLNMERYPSAADAIQGLVHEAAHLLLFAHSIDGPLVTNPIQERYISPLRPDPRPMDGVFHATFVTARLHYVNSRLRAAASATFEPVAVAELDRRLAELRGLYFGGLETIRDHARLTQAGRRILDETSDYMNAA